MFASLSSSNELVFLNIYHTVFELACIFITLSVFFSIWFTSHNNSSDNFILGFGYLIVAIFDTFHTFYFVNLNLYDNCLEISTRFWILARITDAYILFFFTRLLYVKVKRWPALISSLAFVLVISYFSISTFDFIPVLQTEKGITPVKTALELIIIFVYISTLFSNRGMDCKYPKVAYNYILGTILIAIPAEACFTFTSSPGSGTWLLGHILKTISYLFLFRGTFVCTVIYPYNKLEEENIKLNRAYDNLDAALKEKEFVNKTLNDILDTLPVGVLTYDSDNRLNFANRKFEELLECNKFDLYGRSSDEVSGLFLEKEANQFNSAASDSKKVTLNNIGTYRSSGGKTIKLAVTSHDIFNGVLKLFNDAKKEQELENITLQTQTILNAVSNSVLMIDRNKKIVLCNKAVEDICEMDKKDILGKDIDEFNEQVNFEAKELPSKMLNGVNEKQFYEVSLTSTNGIKKVLRIYMASIYNVDGEIIGGICVGTDITEFNKEQQKLIQQEKLALLGQMGAGIVHETRNYLTTIKGRCQLIDMLAPTEDIKNHTQKIINNIDEVNRIISEFLFLSKPREAELIEISMFDVLHSIKSMVETSFLVKGVDVHFYISKEERYLLCDEAQIKQVILNICKNAVDAMLDKKNAKLTIETGLIEEANEIFIRISDNGCGIPQDALNKIGTPFYTTKKTGTGLGLSVCQQIINIHNGRIKAESELGVGTTFTIFLPCINDKIEEPV